MWWATSSATSRTTAATARPCTPSSARIWTAGPSGSAGSSPNGFFGENLTTVDLEVNEARIGERWQVGDEVVLQVTSARIPCSTFRGWVGEKGWLKTFTADARPGAYLSVVTPGTIRGGDEIRCCTVPSTT